MRSFVGWTNVDGEMTKETLITKISDLISSLDLVATLQILAEISHFIFSDGCQNETKLRKKYLSSRLLSSVQKYEHNNGSGFIFQKQSLLILEQIVIGVNSNIENSIKNETIGKLFLYVNSLIEKRLC